MNDSVFGPFEAADHDDGLEILDPRGYLEEHLPELFGALSAITYEQLALVAQVVGDRQTHESVRLLFNLAVNDLRDLLRDIEEGQGRSAMRAARSMIEHAVNLHTVSTSLAQANQYLEHLDLGPALLADLAVGADRLRKGRRRAYLHSLKKAGDSARTRFEKAVAQHGSQFRRGWTQATVRDRAYRQGLGTLYNYYQLASLVTHGSAGGVLGTIRDAPEPRSEHEARQPRDTTSFRTFRTGQALELAPVALWAGLAGYREVMRGLATVRPDVDVAAYTAGLNALDGLWARYFAAMRALDEQTWPTERRPNPSSICAFTRLGQRRWYLYLPLQRVLLNANDPALPQWLEVRIEGHIVTTIAEQPGMFRNDQRWLTISVPQVTVSPDGTGRWLPKDALFEKRSSQLR